MFKETLKHSKTEITIEGFIAEVSAYSSLEYALSELPEVFMEFYLDNESILDRSLTKRNLLEGAESPGYVGWSGTEDIIKVIKYKGHLINLHWKKEEHTWEVLPAFRNVVSALRYGKEMIDNIEK